MKFDFPIDTIEFDFWSIGRSSIQIKVNGRSVSGNVIHGHLLKKHNVITIGFSSSLNLSQYSKIVLSHSVCIRTNGLKSSI